MNFLFALTIYPIIMVMLILTCLKSLRLNIGRWPQRTGILTWSAYKIIIVYLLYDDMQSAQLMVECLWPYMTPDCWLFAFESRLTDILFCLNIFSFLIFRNLLLTLFSSLRCWYKQTAFHLYKALVKFLLCCHLQGI